MTPKTSILLFKLICFCLIWGVSPHFLAAQQFGDDPSTWEGETDGSTFEDENFQNDVDLNAAAGDSEAEREGDKSNKENKEAEEFEQGKAPKSDYVDESVLPGNSQQLLEAEWLRRKNLLSSERANVPLNVGYGIGTGLMIGSWFALLFAGTSRDTLRSIGLGIVLGGFVGSVMGTRAVISPSAPRPPSENELQDLQDDGGIGKNSNNQDPRYAMTKLRMSWNF